MEQQNRRYRYNHTRSIERQHHPSPICNRPTRTLGTILQSFLLTPSLTAEPITFPSSRPHAQTMYQRATTHPAPTGILISADSAWKCKKNTTILRFLTHRSHTIYPHTSESWTRYHQGIHPSHPKQHLRS